ncbi:MAG: substrate-binding domain-containing protein [Planctomycetes bacterium]|nr:substrate-binding domain-containing protein [Planctomycetota bacterium]
MRGTVQYKHLAGELAAAIRKRTGGEKPLPSVRALAKTHKVSVFTVSKALKMLEHQGVIERRWGIGCFAAPKNRSRRRAGGTPCLGIVLDPERAPSDAWSLGLMEALSQALRSENVRPAYVSWRKELALDPQIDGLIVTSHALRFDAQGMFHEMAAWLQREAAGGLPVVTVDAELSGAASVQIDNAGGAYQAARYLIQLGHRRIAYVGMPDSSTSLERLHGLRRALEEAGERHEDALVWETKPSPRSVFAQFRNFYRAAKFTAVCFFEDSSAAAAAKAASEMGVRVPQDLSVVGFGNLPLGEFAFLPLTTVDPRPADLAERAVRVLLDALHAKHPLESPPKLRVQTQLILRDSTGPAPVPE